jgi:hypothetical protein
MSWKERREEKRRDEKRREDTIKMRTWEGVRGCLLFVT